MLDDEAPKIYGLDDIQENLQSISQKERLIRPSSTTQSHYVVQMGMFTSGVLAILLGFMITKRNREICKRIESTIDRGDKIVIWPSNIVEKDINDMVLGGHDEKGGRIKHIF